MISNSTSDVAAAGVASIGIDRDRCGRPGMIAPSAAHEGAVVDVVGEAGRLARDLRPGRSDRRRRPPGCPGAGSRAGCRMSLGSRPWLFVATSFPARAATEALAPTALLPSTLDALPLAAATRTSSPDWPSTGVAESATSMASPMASAMRPLQAVGHVRLPSYRPSGRSATSGRRARPIRCSAMVGPAVTNRQPRKASR